MHPALQTTEQAPECQQCTTPIADHNAVQLITPSGSATLCGCCYDVMPSSIKNHPDVTAMDMREFVHMLPTSPAC